jgi:hypothetical protein
VLKVAASNIAPTAAIAHLEKLNVFVFMARSIAQRHPFFNHMALAQVSWQTLRMRIKLLAAVLITAIPLGILAARQSPVASQAPSYTADGQLQFPENFRQWVYLSSGFDMSYNPAASADRHIFDNVFVNPDSYDAFLKTGTWPDKTMLVLESRRAQDKGSITKSGQFQSPTVQGVEVHIKDESRFPGKWAFFGFGSSKTGKLLPATASCYSCHSQHGAVDTTFVQFYPTLLPIAATKNTISPSYAKEAADLAGSTAAPTQHP